jgi:acetylornithine deacetylase
LTLTSREADDLCAAVDRRSDAILQLLHELVAIPSPNPPGQEGAVAAHLDDVMGSLGLADTVALDATDGRPDLLWRSPDNGERTVVALAGHLDTKPPGPLDEWRTDPWTPTLDGDRIVGLGTSDMKGALAAMVHAAAIVLDVAPPRHGRFMLAFTSDEEYAMGGARRIAGTIDADAIVIGEPAGTLEGWERLYLGSRGLVALRVSVEGTQMHSSLSDVVPSVNASADLAWVLHRMHERFRIVTPPHPYSTQGVTVNVGVTVSGGVQYGVYPGHAEFGVDIRVPPGVPASTIDRALDEFFASLRDERPQVMVSWAKEAPPLDWMPATETPADHPVVRAASDAMARVLGTTPPLGVFPGGTEAVVYQAGHGIACLPALGPGILGVSHAPNEYVRASAVLEAAKVYALIVGALTR